MRQYSSTSIDNEYDLVIIRGLEIVMSVGIYDFEKAKPQRVLFDIILEVRSNKGCDLTDISSVVSYEDVCYRVEEICTSKHYDLVELLAEDIAKMCLSYDVVGAVELEINKPDIIKNTTSVGVKIKRQSV